ncbi:MAG: hypothetical protein ACR2KK_08940 [Acidimicrobiales bacterium]
MTINKAKYQRLTGRTTRTAVEAAIATGHPTTNQGATAAPTVHAGRATIHGQRAPTGQSAQ